MPIYEYAARGDGCKSCERTFEVLQSMDEPALEACPDCGAPVKRLLSCFSTASPMRVDLSDGNLGRKGFTKYEKTGDGTYERTAGTEGPKIIQRDS